MTTLSNVNGNEKCAGCARSVMMISALANVVMAFVKGFVGFMTGSKVLLADALHSGADIICGFFSILSSWTSGKQSDQKHPYGYGKIEFFVGIVVGLVLIFAAANIFIPSFKAFFLTPPVTVHAPPFIALWVALLSIYANIVVSQLTLCAAKRVNSPALDAISADNRSDAYSSVPVALAIMGAQLGFPQLDSIGAIFVSIIILKIAVTLVIKNYRGLMDAAAQPQEVQNISKIVKSLPEVKDIGYLKTRLTGRNIWVDLQVLVDGKKTVSEADLICTRIRSALIQKINTIGNVQVTLKPV
ncbi:MAG: cation transporter [Planctomycetes bacterium]|nr:cation transporter [Planctomycetota bacterium]